MSNESHYIKLARENLESNANVIKYCKEALASDICEWEKREYRDVLDIETKATSSLVYSYKFAIENC